MVRDRVLVAVSALFTLAGLWLLGRDLRVGVGTTVFFGSCLLAFASREVARARTGAASRVLGAPGGRARVEGIGGVRIHASRTRPALATLVFVVVGLAFSWEFAPEGVWPAALGWCATAFGIGAGAVILGQRTTPWLMLRPDGLELGNRRARYTVPWDDILGAQLGELYRNPVVFIALRSLDATLQSVEPRAARERTARGFATSTSFTGFPLLVQPARFGIEPAVMVKALQLYASDRGRRAELTMPRALGEAG